MNRRQFSLAPTAALAAATLSAFSSSGLQAAPAKMAGKQAYELAATGHGFTVGPVMAANTVYVFFDTTCPHCAHLWESARPLLGKLKMVWMPLGYLRPQSTTQGATILSAADPVAAMTENETKVLARQGGISVPANLSEAAVAKVKANTEIFTKLGSESVPLIVFRNARTGEYGSETGAASTEQLAAMVGL